jgi:hypothetical protein
MIQGVVPVFFYTVTSGTFFEKKTNYLFINA